MKPSTKEDLQQIINNLQAWLQISYSNLQLRKEKESAEIALAVLKGISEKYEEYLSFACEQELRECCNQSALIISKIMSSLNTRSDIKILTLYELQQIAGLKVFEIYDIIDLKKMCQNKGYYEISLMCKIH